MQKSHTRRFRRVLLAALCLVLLLKSRELALGGWLKTDDFVAYWAAARLQLSGQNPYSEANLLQLQQSVGWQKRTPLIGFNPPWALFFALPFSFLAYPLGRLVWLAAGVAVMVFCTDWIWRFYGGPRESRRLAWFLGGIFLPALMGLSMGQIAPLMLLGVTGFLLFVDREQWIRAGAVLVLLALKPHLFYLFWVALLLWLVDRRRWGLCWGAVAGLLLTTGIPLVFNPAVLRQYWEMIRNEAPPLVWLTPTLATYIRSWFGTPGRWMQFLPMLGGYVWLIFYWRRHRHTWDWKLQMPVLLLVSLATVSYGWVFDQVVLLPFLLQAMSWTLERSDDRLRCLALGGYALINALLLVLIAFRTEHSYYVWLAPVWLGGYLYLRARSFQPNRGDAMSWSGIRDSAVG
jgi:Glycosyltransferase family 87